jgi:hypothetical protein
VAVSVQRPEVVVVDRAPYDDRDQVGTLGALRQLRSATVRSATADAAVADAVAAARAFGASWAAIGDVLGITRQGAYQRFGLKTRDVLGLDDR